LRSLTPNAHGNSRPWAPLLHMIDWTLALVAAVLAAGVLVGWIVILAEAVDFHRGHATVQPRPDDIDACGDVAVSVIVPANNEAANLQECLQSVLAQRLTRFELIVVDDRSTDTTRAIAERLAATDTRVRVEHVDDVPAGWTGKTHALHYGAAMAAAANAGWLLFTDADTIHQPGCVAACLRYASERHLDLLSGWPGLVRPAFITALTAPMCGAVFASWFRKRGRGGPRRFAAFANGQFLLIRAAVYRELGGHAAVRGHLLEDVALAERIARHGRAFEVVLLHRVLGVKAYATIADCRLGWSRLFLEGARRHIRRLLRPATVLPALATAGYVVAACAAVALHDGRAPVPWAIAAVTAVLAVMAMTVTVGFVAHHTGVAPPYALLAPLSALLTAAFLTSAVRSARTNQAIEWHGIKYEPQHETHDHG